MRNERAAAWVMAAVVVAASAGCSHPLKTPRREQMVQLQRSGMLAVVLQNGTDLTLQVEGRDGVPGMLLPAHGMVTLPFQVVKTAKLTDMSPRNPGGLAVGPAGGLLLVDTPADRPYVDMDGLRAVVRVREPGGAVWVFPIELGECVFCGTPSVTVVVEGRPRATAEAARLCPEGGY